MLARLGLTMMPLVQFIGGRICDTLIIVLDWLYQEPYEDEE